MTEAEAAVRAAGRAVRRAARIHPALFRASARPAS
jgi:hypothetical protein